MFKSVRVLLIYIGVAAVLILGLPLVAMEIIDPLTEIELCSDHGGRWNRVENKCECTREELSQANISEQRTAYCNRTSPT